MNEELKACPFCGSTQLGSGYIRDGRVIRCLGCSASGAPMFHGKDNDTEKRAIAAWNRRPPSQSVRETADGGVTGKDESQNWAGMDGATAWHLMDRHGGDWADIGRMMHAWRDAAITAALLAASGG